MSNQNKSLGAFSGSHERSNREVILPSGRKITVLETTGKEEQILSKLKDRKPGILEEYLCSVTEKLDGAKGNPTSQQMLDMLSGDRTMILMYVRLLTHGEIVTYKLSCKDCNAKSEHEINIEQIIHESKPYPFREQKEFFLDLPEGKIYYELSTGETEKKIAGFKDPDINTKLACTRIWEVLEDGTKMPIKIENLKSKYISTLRKEMKEKENVLDTVTTLRCPTCKSDTIVDAVVNADFLFPNSM